MIPARMFCTSPKIFFMEKSAEHQYSHLGHGKFCSHESMELKNKVIVGTHLNENLFGLTRQETLMRDWMGKLVLDRCVYSGI
jgi:hypothetical protein